MDKKQLSERDICTKYITPALERAGWDVLTQIREEFPLTKGRVIVRGKLHTRAKHKRADYILFYKPNIPIAVIEAKDNIHSRMGRLWQTLLLSRWNPLFAHVPVESLVYEHQQEYYQALQKSTDQGDSAPFVEFMLGMIFDAVPRAQSKAPLWAQSDAIRNALVPEPLSANELVLLIKLRSKTGAFKRSIKYLLEEGDIEYTIPDKPNSRLQKYRLTDKGRALLAAGGGGHE